MTPMMNDPFPTSGPPGPIRSLRRSRSDRMITGVAGGLGEYFGVDPVIFRVLFAVLSFFGGVGLLIYIACWLLMPEPDVEVSALDRAVAQLRMRRVPPWVVIVGGVLVLWIGWFSWWAPGPTFPALVVVAVLLLVLVRRLSTPTPQGRVSGPPPPAPYPWQPPPPPQGFVADSTATDGTAANGMATDGVAPDSTAAASESATGEPPLFGPMTTMPLGFAGTQAFAEPTEPIGRLAPPLDDPRRSMGRWYVEAREAQRSRSARRRPIRAAGGIVLLTGLAFLGILDATHGISFAVYLWFLLAVFGIGFLVSAATRRTVWEYGWLLLPLIPALIVFGGTDASLKDGSGQIGVMPANAGQVHDIKQFAGQTTLDLTSLPTITSDQTVNIRQGAGEVIVRVPSGMNAVVQSKVHLGDIQLGTSRQTGQYVSGLNTSLTIPAPPAATGPTMTVSVDLTVGHVQIERVG